MHKLASNYDQIQSRGPPPLFAVNFRRSLLAALPYRATTAAAVDGKSLVELLPGRPFIGAVPKSCGWVTVTKEREDRTEGAVPTPQSLGDQSCYREVESLPSQHCRHKKRVVAIGHLCVNLPAGCCPILLECHCLGAFRFGDPITGKQSGRQS